MRGEGSAGSRRIGRGNLVPYDVEEDLDRRVLADLQRQPPPPAAAQPAASGAPLVSGSGPSPSASFSEAALWHVPGRGGDGTPGPGLPPRAGSFKGGSSPPADNDLMSSLLKRLATLEREVATARGEVRAKEAHLLHLQAEHREQGLQLGAARAKLAEKTAQALSVGEDRTGAAGPSHEDRLKEENSRLRASRDGIREENGRLHRQVIEMEAFLRDYGMIWVGPGSGAKYDGLTLGGAPVKPTAAATAAAAEQNAAAAAFRPDGARLAAAVSELNLLAGDGTAEVTRGARGARQLRGPTRLPLVMWLDGFVLGAGGPYRSYTQPDARAFVQDLLDGYFPSELKESHPEGVPLDLNLESAEKLYRHPFVAFTGAARALAPGAAVPLTGAVTPTPPTLSKDAFLARLPPAVIRGGRIVDVRASMAAILTPEGGGGNAVPSHRRVPPGGGPGDAVLEGIDLPGGRRPSVGPPLRPMSAGGNNASQALGALHMPSFRPPTPRGEAAVGPGPGGDAVEGSASRPGSARPLPARPLAESVAASRSGSAGPVRISSGEATTLHVKREDGTKTYVLLLRGGDTVGDLRRALDRLREADAPRPPGAMIAPKQPAYEIRSAFPARVFGDPGMTLDAAGLVPNAALVLRLLSKALQ